MSFTTHRTIPVEKEVTPKSKAYEAPPFTPSTRSTKELKELYDEIERQVFTDDSNGKPNLRTLAPKFAKISVQLVDRYCDEGMFEKASEVASNGMLHTYSPEEAIDTLLKSADIVERKGDDDSFRWIKKVLAMSFGIRIDKT